MYVSAKFLKVWVGGASQNFEGETYYSNAAGAYENVTLKFPRQSTSPKLSNTTCLSLPLSFSLYFSFHRSLPHHFKQAEVQKRSLVVVGFNNTDALCYT